MIPLIIAPNGDNILTISCDVIRGKDQPPRLQGSFISELDFRDGETQDTGDSMAIFPLKQQFHLKLLYYHELKPLIPAKVVFWKAWAEIL